MKVATAYAGSYPTIGVGRTGFDAVWAEPSGVWTEQWTFKAQAWSAPRLISRQSSQTSTELADSKSGAAAVAWEYLDERQHVGDEREYVRYRAPNGAWQQTYELPDNDGFDSQSLGIDAKGNAYLLWDRGQTVVLSEHTATADKWSKPMIVVASSETLGTGPVLSVSPDGAIAIASTVFPKAVLRRYDQKPTLKSLRHPRAPTYAELNDERVVINIRSGSGRWRSRTVGIAGHRDGPGGDEIGEWAPNPLSVAIDNSGTAYVGWQVVSPKTDIESARLAVVPDGGSAIHRVGLPDSSDATSPALTGLAEGAVVGWYPWVSTVRPNGRLGRRDPIYEQFSGSLVKVTNGMCAHLGRVLPGHNFAVAPDGLAMSIWQTGAVAENARYPIRSYTHRC